MKSLPSSWPVKQARTARTPSKLMSRSLRSSVILGIGSMESVSEFMGEVSVAAHNKYKVRWISGP